MSVVVYNDFFLVKKLNCGAALWWCSSQAKTFILLLYLFNFGLPTNPLIPLVIG